MTSNFEIKPTARSQFVFKLLGGDGEVVLTSERYMSLKSANGGIRSVRLNAAQDARYDRRTAAGQTAYFVLRAGNALGIGRSPMYASVSAMEAGIASVKSGALTATVTHLT